MNSEKIYKSILFFGAIFGALALLFLLIMGSIRLGGMIDEDINRTNQSKIECEEIGGTVERSDEFLTPFSFECVDYDEDGFKFYWHKNKDGEFYKTR
jgi:hypothetical protein